MGKLSSNLIADDLLHVKRKNSDESITTTETNNNNDQQHLHQEQNEDQCSIKFPLEEGRASYPVNSDYILAPHPHMTTTQTTFGK